MKHGLRLLLVVLTAACDRSGNGIRSAGLSPGSLLAGTASSIERRDQSRDLNASRHTAIVEAASRAAPAVVSVNVVRRERQISRSPFDFFFIPREYERVVQGYGSGFIISSDGVVITNQHVTEGAEQIVVTTREGTDYDARLLGEDPLTDIAVLKIDGSNLPAIEIGTSTDLEIGEWVLAIGNPYAYLLGNSEPTVTAGVVSAIGRNLLPSSDQSGVYVGMIQTDAAINPGNSGGPLVDALGRVVGVNSSIFSNSGGSIGIGFAIPIERAVRVARELEKTGTVRRPWAGLDVSGGGNLREWKKIGGLRINDVAPGSPADRAGIRRGDVLLSVLGRRMRTYLDWESVKLDVGPQDTVRIEYSHNGKKRHALLPMTDLPTSRAEKISVLRDLQVINISPAVRVERGIQSKEGVMIYEITERARRNTGLEAGDVIVQINRRRIRDADDVKLAFRAAEGRGAVRVFFERAGRIQFTDFYVR